jgi:hypothetical protein
MIEGTIHHINDVLYVYYLHPDNTHANKELNEWIQRQAKKMYNEYIVPMTLKWCKENKYKSIGFESLLNPDIKDNSIGLLVINNLHSLPATEMWMARISKVLAPGGVAIISNPIKVENTNEITEKHLRFWDKNYSKISINGSGLEGNHIEVLNNKVVIYFTKRTPDLHLAQNILNYN